MRDYILYHNATNMGYDLEGNYFDRDAEEGIGSEAESGMNIFCLSQFYDEEFYEPDWEFFVGDDSLDDLAFSIVTSNKKETRESIDQRVWVIQGEALSSPRAYYLHGFFYPRVADRTLIEVGGKKFKYRLSGGDEGLVLPLSAAVRLDRSGWFGGVLREFQNFRFGFREINNSAWINHLEEIYEEVIKIPIN